MDGFSDPGARHPLLRAGDRVEAALKDVADLDPLFLPTRDKREALQQLTRLTSQLEGMRPKRPSIRVPLGCATARSWQLQMLQSMDVGR